MALTWVEKIKDLPSRTATFVAETRAELKKVTWPGKKEIYGTTVVVIVSVFFFGFYLFLVDSILQVLVQRVFALFL